jgi:dipeptide/tripeptide permease
VTVSTDKHARKRRVGWLGLRLLNLIPLSAAAAVIAVLTWKVGWWLLIWLAAMYGIAGLWVWRMKRRYAREAAVDPEAARKAQDQRLTRWVKGWGLFMAGSLVFVALLAIVLAAIGHLQ